jgi:hypothetical protein
MMRNVLSCYKKVGDVGCTAKKIGLA